MKKITLQCLLSTILAATSFSAFAASDGFYVGGNLGWGRVGYYTSNLNYLANASIQRTGVAGGADFGYQFNQYIAAELGYTWMPRVRVNNGVLNSNPTGSTTLANGSVQDSAWDLALRGMLPMQHGFGVNAKAGMAYVKQNVSNGMDNSALGSDYQSHSKLAPELGAGVSYDFSQYVSGGVNYTRIIKTGNIRSVDLVLANLSYHFG